MTDATLEQRLRSLYEVSVPTGLDRRLSMTLMSNGRRTSRRRRPSALAALAFAALTATVAAVPAVMWFEGWNHPFDHIWQIATPVDQTVTADGYEVTLHRAYADRLGVRIAISVNDLNQRWSAFSVENADVVDADGHFFEAWNWSGSRSPIEDSTATWSRFLMPAGLGAGDLELRVTVTSLMVRAREPIRADAEADQIWHSVPGNWSFEVHVPVTQGESLTPKVNPTTRDGVTIGVDELGLVPSGTVLRLAVKGLPEGPAGKGTRWFPVGTVVHDGAAFGDDTLEPGLIGSDGVATLELSPVVSDLAGHWQVTVLGFHSFDPVTKNFGYAEGPWILEFDVPETT